MLKPLVAALLVAAAVFAGPPFPASARTEHERAAARRAEAPSAQRRQGGRPATLTARPYTRSDAQPSQSRERDWPFYGGDQGGMKYSPLSDISTSNVSKLSIAWQWATHEKALAEFGTRPGNFQATPIMIDGVLYLSTPYNRVVALNADTGAELWSYDPKPYEDGQPPNGTGFVHRGVAAWRDRANNDALRIFINSRYRLICLDAKTGRPVDSFGSNGIVDLSKGLVWEINKTHYTNTSPPVVYKDLVILGNGVGDRLVYRNDPPGDVRAFDAHTGKQVWAFRPIPQPGEFGNDTWANDSWSYTGHTNVWPPFTLDAERGLVYLPFGTPSNDFYGGRRRGANVFAESLVCLDAATGVRKWHYQIVHHGLWDYDNPSPPNLVTLHVDGRTIDAVVQLTKQGFVFVFDRVTGAPVWPIEERPVPPSDVEGEQAWPTQPAPIRPPPITEQGVTLDDAFDLTPALKAAAQKELAKYRIGPVFTPPTLKGTVQRPGLIGGANWGGGAFDPASGVLYVKTTNQAAIARVGTPDRSSANPRASEVDAEITRIGDTGAEFMDGLPLLKPPYGHLVAIDLNHGTIKWRVPFGDTPSLRRHPALKDVRLPPVLGVAGAPGVIATAAGLVIGGGGDLALHAINAATGAEIWQAPLPRRVNGTPMTYRTGSGRQMIVVATGGGEDAALVAFAIPAPASAFVRGEQ
ncbi:MAG TPA: pyrroloquinoline quinone-dependent dehydrogenase [Vicinamibacterales bacterium]|nr:pyrroloquinoline quinone-dependent dehydrogenase [Vicinamibacterales bacterium]